MVNSLERHKFRRLAMLRDYNNSDIEYVAEHIGLSVDVVRAWEDGTAEPDIIALRDLAIYVYHTSVDDLLGVNPFTPAVVSTGFLYSGGEEESLVSGFWGHVGILAPGLEKTRWYPIDADEYRYGYRDVQVKGPQQWACIRTLANRVLAINPLAMRRIWFLDEACDGPNEDWEDIIMHNPLEWYRVLDLYLPDHREGSQYDKQTSLKLKKSVSEYIRKRELKTVEGNDYEAALRHWLHDTVIHFTDGTTVSYEISHRDLAVLYSAIDTSHEMNEDDGWGVPKMLHLDHAYMEYQSWFPRDRIAMIDMPMIDLWDAIKREEEENDMVPDWAEWEEKHLVSGRRSTRRPSAPAVGVKLDGPSSKQRGGPRGPRKRVLTPRKPTTTQ